MRLKDKAALVTGAGSGFGKAIAETFAREGARVAVVDIAEKAAKETAAAIGKSAIAIQCDVSNKASVDAAIKDTVAAFGALDILVNNAGVSHVNKPLMEIG
jgi:3-oxoacyl-[acyl-carrier protein] reductase